MQPSPSPRSLGLARRGSSSPFFGLGRFLLPRAASASSIALSAAARASEAFASISAAAAASRPSGSHASTSCRSGSAAPGRDHTTASTWPAHRSPADHCSIALLVSSACAAAATALVTPASWSHSEARSSIVEGSRGASSATATPFQPAPSTAPSGSWVGDGAGGSVAFPLDLAELFAAGLAEPFPDSSSSFAVGSGNHAPLTIDQAEHSWVGAPWCQAPL
mmetsp:Transcript_16359/g.62070  ORF Transcript_16359/g.62070 Transcript_16359/m.62070 type:complete len:221 (+) Transcript_16359:387-1049(+)